MLEDAIDVRIIRLIAFSDLGHVEDGKVLLEFLVVLGSQGSRRGDPSVVGKGLLVASGQEAINA